jgi:hypothetical protein
MLLLYGAKLRDGKQAAGSPAPRRVNRMAGAPHAREQDEVDEIIGVAVTMIRSSTICHVGEVRAANS